ncbi:MAG: ABC transporter substrate-binding protein [Deferrisomatales bacterium]
MKLALALLSTLLAAFPCAFAQEIAVVQSASIEPYNQAVHAFRTALSRAAPPTGPNRLQPVAFTDYVLSEPGASDRLDHDLAGARRPDLILAVGATALKQVGQAGEIPVVYAMVPPPPPGRRPRNATGVEMEIPPARWLESLVHLLPGTKRVGAIYDPERTGRTVARAQAYARSLGVELVALPVASGREVPSALARLAGRVDALWMLPDLTVVTPETARRMLLFSVEHRVPVLTFSERYLKLGAAAALTFDSASMGAQAAEMARRILGGSPVADVPPEPARQVRVLVNRAIEQKLRTPVTRRRASSPDTPREGSP